VLSPSSGLKLWLLQPNPEEHHDNCHRRENIKTSHTVNRLRIPQRSILFEKHDFLKLAGMVKYVEPRDGKDGLNFLRNDSKKSEQHTLNFTL
jgi:hypothetical protein